MGRGKKKELEHPIDAKSKTARQRFERKRGKSPGDGLRGAVVDMGDHVVLSVKNRGQSHAETIGQQIQDALDPTKQHGVGVVKEDTYEDSKYINGMIRAKYLRVVRRTEKAVWVAFGTHKSWLPKDQITFIEGCWIEMPIWLAQKKGVYWRRGDSDAIRNT